MHGRIALMVLLTAFAGTAWAFEECGELGNSYGPFDYRTGRAKLAIVEGAHFTPDIEALRQGNTGTLGNDLDYTLRASPNHHRALIAMVNLARRLNTGQPPGARYTLPCYFDRALRFAGDDPVVRLIYGTYLSRSGNAREGLKQLELALALEETNANVHYNLGLVYFDLKDYPKARLHARRAYELGFTLPGLRKMLVDAGRWELAPGESERPATSPPATPSKAPK